MATVLHTWVTRVYCPECESYSWTNPGSGSVICACSSASIIENVIMSGDAVTDESAFRSAVAADLGVDEADLELLEG